MKISRATAEDVDEILDLQNLNLKDNLSEEEKKDQGFVSLKTPKDLLIDIVDKKGAVVVREEEDLAGYFLSLSPDQAAKLSFLDPLVETFKKIKDDDISVTEKNWCIAAQICVAKKYRGSGIAGPLNTEGLKMMAEKYDIALSEIASDNPRSIHVNINKNNWKVLSQYNAHGKEWYIIGRDLTEFK